MADVADVADVVDVVVVMADGVVMETGMATSAMVTGLVIWVMVVVDVAVAEDGDVGIMEDAEDIVMEDAEDLDMDVGDAVVVEDVVAAESSDLSWLKTAKSNRKNNRKSNPMTAPRQPKNKNLLQRPIKRRKGQVNDGVHGGAVEDAEGWVTWVEDHGVVVEDLVIGTGVDVAPLEAGVAMAGMEVVEVVEVVVVMEVMEVSVVVEVMVAVVLEVTAALEVLVLEVDLHPLEVDPGRFSMKDAANLTWVPKVLLIMLMMKNCRRKRLLHCQ